MWTRFFFFWGGGAGANFPIVATKKFGISFSNFKLEKKLGNFRQILETKKKIENKEPIN